MPRGIPNPKPGENPDSTPDAPDSTTDVEKATEAIVPSDPSPVAPEPTSDGTKPPATAADELRGEASKAKGHKTKAQTQREQARAAQAEQDKVEVASAPSFVVVYPTGISRRVTGTEAEYPLSTGGSVWVDVVPDRIDKDKDGKETPTKEGHVAVPVNAVIRAESGAELADFRRLASQGFLKAVAQ